MAACGEARTVGVEADGGEGEGDAVVGSLGGGGDGQGAARRSMGEAMAGAEGVAPSAHVPPDGRDAAVEGGIVVGSEPWPGSIDGEEAVAAKAVGEGSDRTHVKVHTGSPAEGPEVSAEHVVAEAAEVVGSSARHKSAEEVARPRSDAVL
ncbi:MAG: hypothetical protein VX000_14415 [Myxococcota bacterium]|nr:hypothetical protein [Myxococcota bacterium]